MTPQEKQKLKSLFVATALYYGQDLPDSALCLFVEDLEDLPLFEIEIALKAIRRDPKSTRCPLPAMIRSRIEPDSNPESEAIFISNLIVQAISKVGPYQIPNLPPVAKEIIRMEGGWENLCERVDNDNLGMLKAQWRGLARVLLERGVREEPLALPSPSAGLLPLKNLLPEFPK